MLSFQQFIQGDKIVSKLKKYYLKSPFDEKEIAKLNLLIQEIIKVKENKCMDKNVDLLSQIYEKEINFKDRRKLGEIYTPISVVRKILKKVGYTKNNNITKKTIIDISCGAGSFLIEAIELLKKKLLKDYNDFNTITPNADNLIEILNKIRDCVYGIDLNPIACILCQLNMFLCLMDLIRIIKLRQPHYEFPLFNIVNSDTIQIKFDKKYDFIVGNPPYLFIRDIPVSQRKIIESQNLKTNSGQYDLYQIFIELGIRLLNEKGHLGFIVPDSILVLSNRKEIRKYIYENTKISHISIVGSQFNEPVVSNIIIILQRESQRINRIKNEMQVSNDLNHTNIILPQMIIEKFNYKFLVNLDSLDLLILEKMIQVPKLGDLLKDQRFKMILARGVELNKSGKVIFCDTCKMYLPVPKASLKCNSCESTLKKSSVEKIIQKEIGNIETDNFRRLLYSINRYEIKECRYIRINKPGINYKSEEIYKDRIVIRQLNQNNLICATYDKFSYTTQSFYNLKVKNSQHPEFTDFYLLGLLNSSLLSYYFIKSFGSYKKLFPRILIEKIESLPIKVPITEKEKALSIQIHQYVEKLIKKNTADPKIMEEIDKLIYDLYEIDKRSIKHVKSSLKVT
ncbi:MAG: hypothetical protein EU532_12090 [Promethearchaeota archaeon]|nr:MAG: hypothetical protein EU532_12090 [Candidatus Lokiarchaeota archaeon]